jgi:hypothetical protein
MEKINKFSISCCQQLRAPFAINQKQKGFGCVRLTENILGSNPIKDLTLEQRQLFL